MLDLRRDLSGVLQQRAVHSAPVQLPAEEFTAALLHRVDKVEQQLQAMQTMAVGPGAPDLTALVRKVDALELAQATEIRESKGELTSLMSHLEELCFSCRE